MRLPKILSKYLFFLATGLLHLIGFLPPRLHLYFGRQLGRLLGKLLKSHRKTIAINTKLCFPEQTDTWRGHLMARYFESFGMGLSELFMAGFTALKRYPLIEVKGLEEVELLRKAGRPIIFISAHLTNFILLGRLISQYFPFSAVFRLQRNPTFNEFLTHHALKKNVTIISPRLNEIVKVLKKGEPVLYFPDQDKGAKHSVFAPFFGISTASVKGLPFLVEKTGAAVVPVFCYRTEAPLSYQLVFSPALKNYPTGELIADATTINQIIEQAIKKQPELYFWYYKRFRTRPAGEKAIY